MYIIRVEDNYTGDNHRPVLKKILADLGFTETKEAPVTALILLHDTWVYYSSKDGITYLNKEDLVNGQEETKSVMAALPQLQEFKRQIKLQTDSYDYDSSEPILASEDQERYVLNLVERVNYRNKILTMAFLLELLTSFSIVMTITILLLPPGMDLIFIAIFFAAIITLPIVCLLLNSPSLFSAKRSLAEVIHEWIDPSIKLTWDTLQNPPVVQELDVKSEVVVEEKPTGCGAWLGSFFSHSGRSAVDASVIVPVLS